jgi:hypothetical protein
MSPDVKRSGLTNDNVKFKNASTSFDSFNQLGAPKEGLVLKFADGNNGNLIDWF